MSTGSISEEEVVEVSSDEEEQEEAMDKVMFNKEEMDKVDKKKDEDLRIEEVEEPMVRVVVTQRAKVRIFQTFAHPHHGGWQQPNTQEVAWPPPDEKRAVSPGGRLSIIPDNCLHTHTEDMSSPLPVFSICLSLRRPHWKGSVRPK